jgi:hypothetical protein
MGGTFNNVKVTFDPAKRQAALKDRGLNFADASIVFAGATITARDIRRDYGETRFQTVGFLADRIGDGGLDTARRDAARDLDEKVQRP